MNKGVHKSSHVSGLISGTGILRGVWQLHIHLYAYVSQLTDRDPIVINCKIVLIGKMPGMSGIEVDKRCDMFPSAVFINRVSVVCRIQKELFNAEFRKICFHSEKGMQEGKHVMPGGPL